MHGPKRVLMLYFSLTSQTENVLKVMREELEAKGHSVDMRRITPIPDWQVPVDKTTFFVNWAKVWVGMNLTQPIEEMHLNGDDYDYIVIGFQPWNLAPSIPVNSFLDSPMAEIFRGKKVFGVVTCRTRWERSYRIVRDKIAARGGEMVDCFVVMNMEKEPANMITTINQLFYGYTDPNWPLARLLKLKPYGIGEHSIEIARDEGKELASRLLEDRIAQRKGWRVINKPPSLV